MLLTPLSGLEQGNRAIALDAAELPGKPGAEKLTSEEQSRRFIETTREAGASENKAGFDAALKRIAKARRPAAI